MEVVFFERTGAHWKGLLKSALPRPTLTGTLSRPSGVWSIQGKWRKELALGECQEGLYGFKSGCFTHFITHTYTVTNA